ncbi:MAG: CDP-glycerol glycerophosphotransferase family protein [bacterium]|nr:CDP-glycerol glycerophosphotransferase family protein [bacterium]
MAINATINITDIACKRIILHLWGEVLTDAKKMPAINFWNEMTNETISPQHIEWDGNRFHLWMNVLSVNNEAPLLGGSYYLVAYDGKKRICDAQFAPGYEPEFNNEKESLYNIVINRGAGHYFRGYSGKDLDTGAFYFQVNVAIPGPRVFFIKKSFNKFKNNLRHNLWEITHWFSIRVFEHYKKHAKYEGNRILFTSGSRAEISGNEEFVYKRMLERGLDKDFKFFFDFRPSIDAKISFARKFRFTKLLATSDIIILDDYFPDIYKFDYDPRVKVIQLWHACGAFKSLGFERVGKPGAPPLNTRVHKCYTHMPVSSYHSALHHAEGFCIDESKFYPIGIPRTDIFFDEAYKKKMVEQMYQQFPRAKQAKKVYLYAPTFRGDNALNAYFPFEKVDFEKWGKFLKERDEYLIIKMHPFVRESVVIPEEYKDYMIDAASYREVNDILFIVDTLITDYSSIIYEFSLLNGRPMYFYAFDQKMYEATRDFYETYEQTVPGKIVKRFDDLLEALAKEDYSKEQLEAFVKKNFTYTDGKATDRVIDQLILGQKS